jgi:hypothetical protein
MLLEHPTPAIARATESLGFLSKFRSFNHELAGAVTITRFREDSELECIQCNRRWPIFLDENATFEIIREHDQHRLETPLGIDTRLAGGRSSVKDSSLTFTFERRWFQRIEFEWEEMTAYGIGGEAEMAVPLPIGNLLAKLKPKFERTIKSRLSVQEETEMLSRATIEVPVPAGRETKVLLHWKQIWQVVICDIRMRTTDRVLQVPYRRLVDVVYDHEIIHMQPRQSTAKQT